MSRIFVVIAYVPEIENSVQAVDLATWYKTLQPGDAFLVLPTPRDEEPDPTPVLFPTFRPVVEPNISFRQRIERLLTLAGPH